MQPLRNSTPVPKKLNSVSLRQLPVAITAGLHVGDGLLIQRVGPAGEVVLQGCETVLSHEEVHEFIHVRLRGVQLEGVLPLHRSAGVVAVELPVAAVHRLLHFLLSAAHAGLDVLL